jgi:hypothetical protein
MTRIMRLWLLARDLVEAIQYGSQRPDLALPLPLNPFSTDWTEQCDHLHLFDVRKRAPKGNSGDHNEMKQYHTAVRPTELKPQVKDKPKRKGAASAKI